MKYTPKLTFLEDPAIVQGARIEEILRDLALETSETLEPGEHT